MALNLNQLRILRTVLDHGSITAAAHALRISQPAVSRQLAELEAAVGARLVDRLPRGVRPTAAGELLGERARRIFAEESAAEREMGELLGLERGRLAVGASTTIGGYLVPEVLGDFATRHGRVALVLQIGNTRAIEAGVLDGSLDLGLTEGLTEGLAGGLTGADALDVDVFTQDELVLIAGPEDLGGPLAGVRSVAAADLARVPFIVREAGSGTREVIEAALAGRGVALEPALEVGSTEAIKNAVARGLGVAIVSSLTVALEREVGRLRVVDVVDLAIRRDLHRLALRGRQPSPAAEAFTALLQARYGPGRPGGRSQ